jgi:hypothetical protein
MICANPECRKEFKLKPRGKNKMFCSHVCVKRVWYLKHRHNLAAPKPKTKACLNCDKRYQPKRNAGKFCSRQCQLNYRYKNKSPKQILTKVCQHCNSTFQTTSNKKIYCTMPCGVKHHDSIRDNRLRRIKRSSFGIRHCVVCGTPFKPLWDSPKKRSQTCMDKKCRRLSDKGILEIMNKHNNGTKIKTAPEGLIKLIRAEIKLKRILKQQTT